MRIFIILALFLLSFSPLAQEIENPLPITGDNILQLQSVDRLSFEDIVIPASVPGGENVPLAVDIQFGWFSYHPGSGRFLLVDSNHDIQVISIDGTSTFSLDGLDFVTAVPFGDGYFAMLFVTEDGFQVRYDDLNLYGGTNLTINVTTNEFPSTIWVTCPDDSESAYACYANVEAAENEYAHLYTMPAFNVTPGDSRTIELSGDNLEFHRLAPEGDSDAVVRIGRIPYPYVVTSSLEGLVKLWDIDTDEIVYEANNSTGEPSVFGNINADATHLVWRDNANETLYLLDFETGENREIAPLNGDYAQWYFLSNDASVIIAVNLGGEPNIVTWDTATGERTNLGDYRDCERPQPDMARLTADGTTLIIGCDTGLDIWRINQGG